MTFLKKNKLLIISLFLVSFIFFFLRLIRLLDLPIFIDEAIYINWAKVAKSDGSLRFISLGDGKQPSFVWFVMLVMHYLKDPLLAGRITSVFAGFASLIGIFFLTKELFKDWKTAIISSFLYAAYPFSLVLDRMALYDSLVGTFAIWSLFFEILMVRKLRLDISLILGFILGGGVLTKTSSFFNIYLLPLTLILFNFKKELIKRRFIKWIALAFISVFFAYLYYSILLLSYDFKWIGEKNHIFVYSFTEFIKGKAYLNFGKNFFLLLSWLIAYMTLPLFGLSLLSFMVSKKYKKEKILLILWFFFPFLGLVLFGKVFYPRFIFFMTLSLIPLAAFSFTEILSFKKNKLFKLSIVLFLLIFPIYSDFFIVTNFAKSPIPKATLSQFLNDWPSGGGAKEIVSYLEDESSNKKIYVAAEGYFGSLPKTIIEIYLKDNKNVEESGIWPIEGSFPKNLSKKACGSIDTYLILNQVQVKPKKWPLILIAKYQKGTGNSFMSLYKVDKSSLICP